MHEGQLQQIVNYRHGPHPSDRMGQAVANEFSRKSKLGKLAELIQSRRLAALFVLVVLTIVALNGGSPLGMFVCLVFPLICIWFPEALGNITGIRYGLAGPMKLQPTPAIAVALAGWIVMLTIVGFVILQS